MLRWGEMNRGIGGLVWRGERGGEGGGGGGGGGCQSLHMSNPYTSFFNMGM